jgi:hypothetical protein
MIASIAHPAYDLSAIREIEGTRGFERGNVLSLSACVGAFARFTRKTGPIRSDSLRTLGTASV